MCMILCWKYRQCLLSISLFVADETSASANPLLATQLVVRWNCWRERSCRVLSNVRHLARSSLGLEVQDALIQR